jgi:Zn finger protein HypA/HybF involved in hydrogenase expression
MDLAFAQAHLLAFGTDCLACHDGVDRYGDNFNHSGLVFQLTGKHADVICTQCHLDARTIVDLQSTPQDCLSCHRADEPHEGRFGSDCAACHSTEGWKPAKFDHNLANFKLEGDHREVKCEQCHINNVYKGTPIDCYACHKEDDEHGGKFGTDCAACHQPTGWKDVTFDHNKSNFPLTGRHTGLACEQCHTNSQFAGLSTACSSCHNDQQLVRALQRSTSGHCRRRRQRRQSWRRLMS